MVSVVPTTVPAALMVVTFSTVLSLVSPRLGVKSVAVSQPWPPLKKSAPGPPVSRSLLPRPLMVLRPSRPKIRSVPPVPLSVSFLSVPTMDAGRGGHDVVP